MSHFNASCVVGTTFTTLTFNRSSQDIERVIKPNTKTMAERLSELAAHLEKLTGAGKELAHALETWHEWCTMKFTGLQKFQPNRSKNADLFATSVHRSTWPCANTYGCGCNQHRSCHQLWPP